MPEVITKDGKKKHFSYSKKGMEEAKAHAKMYNGRIVHSHKKDAKVKYGNKKPDCLFTVGSG